MKRITNWAFIDADNALHIDIPILLAELHFEDTPENRELAVKAAAEGIRDVLPNVESFVDEKGQLKRYD